MKSRGRPINFRTKFDDSVFRHPVVCIRPPKARYDCKMNDNTIDAFLKSRRYFPEDERRACCSRKGAEAVQVRRLR